jgi:hypothetical protein
MAAEEALLQITIKDLTGTAHKVAVSETASIIEIKRQMELLCGTPADSQRFVFAGKLLDNDRSLWEYNIQSGSVLHIVIRLRMGSPSSGKLGYDTLS